MSENHFDLRLEELKQRSIDRLVMADVFDVSAFEALRTYLWQKAQGLQSQSTISKQILQCLRSASASIESRAEYLAEARDHLSMAGDFNQILDAIIEGAVEGDRIPGVPRVI